MNKTDGTEQIKWRESVNAAFSYKCAKGNHCKNKCRDQVHGI